MTKKITYRHPWLILAVAVLLLTIANNISAVKLIPTIQAQGEGQDNGNAQGTKIKSVILTHVLLYRGGTLQKELTLTNRDAKYTLAYSCFGRRCDCKKRAEKEVEQGIAEEFLRNVETLRIEEKLWDHAWMEMKIIYLDVSSKTLANVGDIGAAGENVFSFYKPCASVESELKASTVDRKVPAGLIITYDDMHPLWGGTTIVIDGRGSVERHERSRPKLKPTVIHSTISQPRLFELIEQLITLKAWEQQTPSRHPVPDESRAKLTISVNGLTSESWEWFNEISRNNRLVQVKQKMLALK